MEVRCGKCNKLFRVSDDKITGTGIKFTCTRCGEYVKITQDDFEQYKLSQEAVSALASFEPKPKGKAPEPSPNVLEETPPPSAVQASGFDLSESPTMAAASGFDLSEPSADDFSLKEETPPVFEEPSIWAEPTAEPAHKLGQAVGKESPRPEAKPEAPAVPVQTPKAAKPEPPAAPKTAPKAAAIKPPVAETPKPEPAKPEAPIKPEVQPVETESKMPAAAPSVSRGIAKKLFVVFVVLLILAGAGYVGVQYYQGNLGNIKKLAIIGNIGDFFKRFTGRFTGGGRTLTTTEGLSIANPTASIDSANGDLIITGTVENATDKPRDAWYVVAQVYNAQNTVIAAAKMVNGKQYYTKRDYDILVKRGSTLEEIKKNMQEPGTIIPPKGAVNFTIRVMEPPQGVASFNVSLQPFDPAQVLKEMVGEQQQ